MLCPLLFRTSCPVDNGYMCRHAVSREKIPSPRTPLFTRSFSPTCSRTYAQLTKAHINNRRKKSSRSSQSSSFHFHISHHTFIHFTFFSVRVRSFSVAVALLHPHSHPNNCVFIQFKQNSAPAFIHHTTKSPLEFG